MGIVWKEPLVFILILINYKGAEGSGLERGFGREFVYWVDLNIWVVFECMVFYGYYYWHSCHHHNR